MANSLGALVVSLGLNAAEFTSGLTKAEYQARKFGQRLDKEIAAGAKLAAAAFVIMEGAILGAAVAVDRLVKQAANFKDIEERTGASAEALASFSVAAQVAGTSSEEVGAAMNKLAKNLTGVDDESKAAGAALTALGIPIAEFKKLNPAEQIQALAKAFSQFDDLASGGNKAAAAIALLGKSGAQLLPFLKELESGSGRRAILTQREIDAADEYADAQKRASAELNLYAQVAAIQALPAITGLITAAKDFVKELVGVGSATGELARNNGIRDFAEGAVKAFAFVVDAADGVVRAIQLVGKGIGAYLASQDVLANRGSFSSLFGKGRDELKAISESYLKDAQDILNRPQFGATLQNSLDKQRIAEANRRAEDRGFKPAGKVLNFAGAKTGGAADDTARRILDQQIKAQENAIRDEQEILRARERFLQSYYQDDLLSIKEYYDGRKNASDEALRNTLAAYDKEIAALQAFANNPANKATDRIRAETDVAEAIAKRGRAEQDAANASSLAYLDKNRAIQQYTDSVADLDAQVKLLLGDERAAAEIRFDVQNRRDKARFTVEGNTQALANQEFIKKQALAQVDLNKAAREYSLTLDALSVAQGRINLAQEAGNITSLEAIRQRSDLATKTAANLRIQADAQERLARTLVGPEQDQAIAKLAQMRLAVDQLAESANELENTFRRTFEDTSASGLTSFIDGTKSASAAVKDMEKQIIASISRIATQNIAESLFGKKGPGGGIAGLIASLFGAASGGGSLPAEIFQFGKAIGGPVAANQPYIVGERGPELFVPKVSGNIVPNGNMAGSSRTVIQHINVMPGASRTTANQAAMRSGIELQRAIGRNG